MQTCSFNIKSLNGNLALSCVEDYFLALYKEKKNFEFLYYQAGISIESLIHDIFCLHKGFAGITCVERLHDTAKQLGILDMSYSTKKDDIRKLEGCAIVEVIPKFVERRYHIQLFREDHYLLIEKKDQNSCFFLNSTPREFGILNYDDLDSVRGNRVILFQKMGEISQNMRKSRNTHATDLETGFPKVRFDNMDIVEIEYRDFLLSLCVLRKRLRLYEHYENTSYLDWLAGLARVAEYARMKKTLNQDLMERNINKVKEQDKIYLEGIQMQKQVIKAIKEVSGVDDIEVTDVLQELGIDSLRLVEFFLLLEERLGIELDEGRITRSNIVTVQNVIDLMKEVRNVSLE